MTRLSGPPMSLFQRSWGFTIFPFNQCSQAAIIAVAMNADVAFNHIIDHTNNSIGVEVAQSPYANISVKNNLIETNYIGILLSQNDPATNIRVAHDS